MVLINSYIRKRNRCNIETGSQGKGYDDDKLFVAKGEVPGSTDLEFTLVADDINQLMVNN